jgi:hypothetical protein
MATLDKIRDAMRAQPFQPFDLKLVDGTRHTVKHPDYIGVPPVPRPREVAFYEVGAEGYEDYRTHWINLGLVTEVVVPSEEKGQPASPAIGSA